MTHVSFGGGLWYTRLASSMPSASRARSSSCPTDIMLDLRTCICKSGRMFVCTSLVKIFIELPVARSSPKIKRRSVSIACRIPAVVHGVRGCQTRDRSIRKSNTLAKACVPEKLTQPIRMWPSFNALAARSSGRAATAACVPAYALRSVLTTSLSKCGAPSDVLSASAISSLVSHSLRSLISIRVVCCRALTVAMSLRTLPNSAPRVKALSTFFLSCSTRALAALRLMFWTLLPTDCCNVGSDLSVHRMSAYEDVSFALIMIASGQW
ncbi:unnamed protein product [Trichogramma brassicae]|uniref:Uncharacterized protein n=1 Tax=Trichogramma brassicae TaxID=86971 RepID=A0A6H5IAE3_9HYME|nr:unnamed protein product [Trichogramma brassicae]